MLVTEWDMPDHTRNDVLRLHRKGVPISEIAEITGLDNKTVVQILRPGYWLHDKGTTVTLDSSKVFEERP